MGVKGLFKGLFTNDEDEADIEELSGYASILKEGYTEEKNNQIKSLLQEEKDDAIKCKIYLLRRKLSDYNMCANFDEDERLHEMIEEREHKLCDAAMAAEELEKTNLEQAMLAYENMVKENFSFNTIPYIRLAINYRKQKRYEDEVDILKKGIIALSQNEHIPFTEVLLDRLEKAIILREKAKGK